MIDMASLRNGRVSFRHLRPRDRKEFLALTTRDAEHHKGWVVNPQTEQEFDNYLARYDGVNAYGFVLTAASDDGIVGYVNLNNVLRGPYQSAKLGFAVFGMFTRLGIATVCLQKIARYAFEDLDLHRLEADIRPQNQNSRKIVKRLGFTYEGMSKDFIKIDGEWRDHERWSITRKGE